MTSSIHTSLIHVDVDDVRLAVHRSGRGEPLVCLSAIAHDAHDFDALAARIGHCFELICLEWPGHGQSGDDPQPASTARYGDLTLQALDRLGVANPLILGNSIGGGAAIHYAARRPVRGLVLCDSAGLVPVSPFVRRLCGLFAAFFATGERGAAWFGPAFAAYYRMVLPQPAAAAQRRRIIASGRRLAGVLRQAWQSFGRPDADLIETACALDVPIWVAWAKQDRVIPLAYCLPAIRRLKTATLTTFEAGHAAFLEQPDAFAEGFLAFSGALPPTNALRAVSWTGRDGGA